MAKPAVGMACVEVAAAELSPACPRGRGTLARSWGGSVAGRRDVRSEGLERRCVLAARDWSGTACPRRAAGAARDSFGWAVCSSCWRRRDLGCYPFHCA